MKEFVLEFCEPWWDRVNEEDPPPDFLFGFYSPTHGYNQFGNEEAYVRALYRLWRDLGFPSGK